MNGIPRTLHFELPIAADATDDTWEVPNTGPGQLRAVRMRSMTGTRVLANVHLRVVHQDAPARILRGGVAVADGAAVASPAPDEHRVYDTGVLEEGVIPDGGDEAIDLAASDTDEFWADEMGEDGPMFEGPLRLDLVATAAGGAGTQYIHVVLVLLEHHR